LLDKSFKVISKYFQFTVPYCKKYNAIKLRTRFAFLLRWILSQLKIQVTFQDCFEQ